MLQKHVFNFLILITTESFKTISNIKKKIKNQKFISEDKRARSASRLVAIQVLYNYFLLDENIEDIIAKYTLSFESDLNDLFYINNFDREYFQNLIDEFLKNDKQLEKEINSIVKNDWDLGRMSIIDRAILYIGLIEIKIMKKTSKKVIISEYVEMAYQLGGESGFINYSLDALSKNHKN
tara:strand:- start:449 stop:988 length:540 start_codon:yes stop_codon:yes gene_type:complete